MIDDGRLPTFRPSAGDATPAFLFMVVAPLNHKYIIPLVLYKVNRESAFLKIIFQKQAREKPPIFGGFSLFRRGNRISKADGGIRGFPAIKIFVVKRAKSKSPAFKLGEDERETEQTKRLKQEPNSLFHAVTVDDLFRFFIDSHALIHSAGNRERSDPA